ncbi:hypothetical protein O0L34_g9571 [Tuta absoluta]|nr:hypothetical protein O0L34_g9571 [Tuta absoluta]
MDEVLEKFEALGQQSNDEPKTSFDGLYKNWGKLGNQEERRQEILEIQKGNRHSKLDKFRGILELINAVEENEIFKAHPRTYYRPNIYVAGFNRASLTYSNVLMLSEWIIEKPADFNDMWCVVPCPRGVRMLVVAHQGSTKCYTKYGHFRFQVTTALPGGHKPKKTRECCVLDCFYNEKINTMFVLDLLAWNNQPFTDGEAEFRQYWLESQFAELPGLQHISKMNEVIFKLLPKTPCDPASFQQFMMKYPAFDQNFPTLDGLLFYHKRAHYVSGQTPLVGWLYPYMVPEVLGADIQINSAYVVEKPINYKSQKDFIEEFEAKNDKKQKSRSRTVSNSMDTGDSTQRGAKPKKKNTPKPEKETLSPEIMDAEITSQAKTASTEDKMESAPTPAPINQASSQTTE